MTTKVRIEIVGKHMPVMISVLDNKGDTSGGEIITEIGDYREFHVHSGQHLVIREINPGGLPT